MSRSKYRVAVVLMLAATLLGLVVVIDHGPNSTGSVRVLGPWTGAEEADFRTVLAEFTRATGINVDYQGTRAVSQVLLGEVQRGTPPDVAVLPSPGELAMHQRNGHLTALGDEVLNAGQLDDYGHQWQELQELGTGTAYAVPVKVSLKSLIWFSTRAFANSPPETWPGLVTLSDEQARYQGIPIWCMGMGSAPTSGWPGTDWIEEILLRQEGTGPYQKWVAGDLEWTSDEVRKAWATWGSIVSPPGVPSGRSAGVLLTDFGDAGRGMYSAPPACLLDRQGSFIITTYQGYDPARKPGADFDFIPFPEIRKDPPAGEPRAWEVSADLAGMFNDTPAARELMRFLASSDGQRIWPDIDGSGAFSANSEAHKRSDGSSIYQGDAVRGRIAETLASADKFCFDGSDLMPATMRDAFERAVLEYVNNPRDLTDLLGRLDEVRKAVPDEEWSRFSCWA